MMFANLGYFFQEAWNDTVHRPTAILFSLISIALLLLFVSLIFAGGEQLQWLVGQLGREAAIAVFLEEDVTSAQRDSLREELQHLEGVTHLRFVSKEEAQEQMEGVLGQHSSQLTATAGFNPFLSYYEVGVLPAEGVEVAVQAEKLPGVDSVRDNRQTLERLTRLTLVMRLGAVFTLLFVGVVMMITISHIIHLGLMAREEEMEVYRLLGAGPWFAAMPFLLQGSLLGFSGGLVSFLTTVAAFPILISKLHSALPFLPLQTGMGVALAIGPILITTGTVFGLCGSLLAYYQTRI